jgi:hypothetical protein
MLLWALNNFDDVVEVGPVHRSLINSFTNWNRLLKLLDESNDANNSTDGFLWVFVLVGFLKNINSTVKSKGRLISLVDADQKVSEVERTNFS